MPFADKWSLLPLELRESLIEQARESSALSVAQDRAEEVGLSQSRLYKILKKETGTGTTWGPRKPKKEVIKKPEEKKLSPEEKRFLKRLSEGSVSLDEASRLVAARVFEQMLKNPDRFQYLDFFRTEMLKIKKEENQIKESWGQQLLLKLFSGKMPPTHCPKCGHSLMEKPVVEGEVVHGHAELPTGN